jgi:hypothetical protein
MVMRTNLYKGLCSSTPNMPVDPASDVISDPMSRNIRNHLKDWDLTIFFFFFFFFFLKKEIFDMETMQAMVSDLGARPLFTTTAALLVAGAVIAYRDYRAYTALGPHGLPDTFWGWYAQLRMTTKARKDTTVPAPYNLDAVAGPHDSESFLPNTAAGGLSWRRGQAPQVPGFVAPQRQVTDMASAGMKRAMFVYLDALVSANDRMLQTQTSVLEGPVPALGLKEEVSAQDRPEVLRSTRGEMCHIHPPDGSTHLIMSLRDQKKVIELGWGRRHRLSGGGRLPWNYTFIYAPRDDDELAAWKSIVQAGAGFCCAGLARIRAAEMDD